MRPTLCLVLLVMASPLVGCVEPAATQAPQDSAGDDVSTRILLLGDTGTGGDDQYRVASAAARVCAARGCDFAMVMGDLVYEQGVSSPDDVQFESKFEEPFAELNMTFYMTLGNHDNSGGPDNGVGSQSQNGDHMVRYHYRDDRVSDRWYLPDRYYNVRIGPVELFSLDTNTIAMEGAVLGNGTDVGLARQTAWLQESLEASDAPWKLVFGHHPYITNGAHDDAGNFDGTPGLGASLKALIEDVVCPQADFYIAGHDHDLQWLESPAACRQTNLIISGAGAKTRPLADPERHPAHFQQGDTLGFAWLEVAADGFTLTYYDGDAAVLHEATVGR